MPWRLPRRSAGARSAPTKASEAGLIRKEIEPDLLARHVASGYLHILHEWAIGLLDIDQLHVRLAYGLAVSLAALTPPAISARMQRRILQFQGEYLEGGSVLG